VATAPAPWARLPAKAGDAFGVAATVPAAAGAPTTKAVAQAFYAAFQSRDLNAMKALYAPGVTFHDPIYDLQGGDSTMKMWAGVFQKGKNATLTSEVVASDASSATVRWKADYELGGRKVHNESTTTLTITDGKITAQRDDWSWSKWAHQALPLGPLVDVPFIKRGLVALLRML
jgi:ketosteroid isomerase-like protein